jgi:hypothetical protein
MSLPTLEEESGCLVLHRGDKITVVSSGRHGTPLTFRKGSKTSKRLCFGAGVVCPLGVMEHNYGTERVLLGVDGEIVSEIQDAIGSFTGGQGWCHGERRGEKHIFEASLMAGGRSAGFGHFEEGKAVVCDMRKLIAQKRLGMVGFCEAEVKVEEEEGGSRSFTNVPDLRLSFSLSGFYCTDTSLELTDVTPESPSKEFMDLVARQEKHQKH